MTTLTLDAPTAHIAYLLRLADDQLILGHRLSEWTGHAPQLEEDIALANIALDHIGTARSLYDRAAAVHGVGLTEDDYAYRRDARGYFNCLLVERPNGDFAQTIVRQLIYSAFALPFWQAAMSSADETLGGIAGKAEKEARYHVRHAGDWFIRLADGTEESRGRTEAALALMWPYAGELFEIDPVVDALMSEGIAPDPQRIKPEWQAIMDRAFAAGGLAPADVKFMQTGGRNGMHTEHLGYILADLQFLQRAYPGAAW